MSVASESSKKEIPWLSEARENLFDALHNNLFKRLDISAEDFGEPFETVINILNEAIEEAHKVQRARIARGETEDKPDEDSEKKDLDKKVSDGKSSDKKVADEKGKTEEPQRDQLEEETASA